MKKIFLLLVLASIGGVIYFVFFHKTYEKDVVPQTADGIIILDVKDIMKSVIWQKVNGSDNWDLKGDSKQLTGFDKAVKLPDYLFIFHVKGQPANAWYTILEISSEKKWDVILHENHFAQSGNIFSFMDAGIDILRNDNKILVGFTSANSRVMIQKVANEMFQKKAFASIAQLEQLVAQKSHAIIWIDKNEMLEKEALFVGNLGKDQLEIKGTFQPIGWKDAVGTRFDSMPNSVLTLGVSELGNRINQWLPISAKESIHKHLNVQIDSFKGLDKANMFVDFVNITADKDTAMTTTFDDNFNEVKKETVQDVNAPNFRFRFAPLPYDQSVTYLKSKGLLIEEKKKMLFVSMPLVKTWATPDAAGNLNLASANYVFQKIKDSLPSAKTEAQNTIAHFYLQPYLLNPIVKPLLPIWMSQNMQAIQYIKINLVKEQNGLLFTLQLAKRKNG